MKTKIFVCSNSAIDYLNHSKNIQTIPTIIKFSDVEEYNDFIDISTTQFYNRLKITKDKKVTVESQKHNIISSYINNASKEGYEQFIFLIPSKSFSTLAIPVNIVKNENPNLAITVYETNTVCYPLAFMASECDKLLNENNGLIEDAIKLLDQIKNNHHIFFFNPIIKEDSKKFVKRYKKGQAYSLENGLVTNMTKKESKTYFDEIINIIKKETMDSEAIGFICYTDRQSKFISIFEEYISEYILNIKKIKISPLSPGVGVLVGYDALAIGYIIK